MNKHVLFAGLMHLAALAMILFMLSSWRLFEWYWKADFCERTARAAMTVFQRAQCKRIESYQDLSFMDWIWGWMVTAFTLKPFLTNVVPVEWWSFIIPSVGLTYLHVFGMVAHYLLPDNNRGNSVRQIMEKNFSTASIVRVIRNYHQHRGFRLEGPLPSE